MIQIAGADATAGELLSILVFGKIRLTVKRPLALDNRVGKRKVLIGVQCVMVDKDRNWALRGEKMHSVFDRFAAR